MSGLISLDLYQGIFMCGYIHCLYKYLGWVSGGKSCPIYYMIIYYIVQLKCLEFLYKKLIMETSFKKVTGVKIPILYIM